MYKPGWRWTRLRTVKLASKALLLCLAVILPAEAIRAQDREKALVKDPVQAALERAKARAARSFQAAGQVLAAAEVAGSSLRLADTGGRGHTLEQLHQARARVLENPDVLSNPLVTALLLKLDEAERALRPAPLGQTGIAGAEVDDEIDVSFLATTLRARYEELGGRLEEVLREERLPLGLVAVALVESGFNPFARSPKGAAGLWQFMPATARRYGLTIGNRRDDRTLLEESTRAAAKYLRDLYEQFGDWKLALAAYNTGEARIQRIIDRTGIRDFDEMVRRGYLPAETRNYVPLVLVAWSRLKGQSASALLEDAPLTIGSEGTTKKP